MGGVTGGLMGGMTGGMKIEESLYLEPTEKVSVLGIVLHILTL